MRICMVLQANFPPDIRVEKETRALIKAGHEVFVLSMGREGMPDTEQIHGVKVIRRKGHQGSLSRMLDYLFFSVSFVHPFWRAAIADTVKQNAIDAIHVHDLPLVKTGLVIARKFRIPLIADLHENFVEGMKTWMKQWGLKGSIIRILIPIRRWQKLERLCIEQAEKVITVVDENRDLYLKEYEVRPEKIVVVMNVEDLKLFDGIEIDKRIRDAYKNRFIISYVGGFEQIRGLETAVKALPKILDKIPNATLLLVGGKGSHLYRQRLEQLSKELHIDENVVFTGWVDFKYVPSYIMVSDVCLIPHSASGHTDTTIPHKLFQYMAMRKPVVATDVKPIRRILLETKSGIPIPSGDYNKMAEVIVKLHDNKEYARELGANGRRAVETKYNWNNEAKKLRRIYEELERREHARSQTVD